MDFDWKKVEYINDQFKSKPPIGKPLLLREDSYYTWIDELCNWKMEQYSSHQGWF